ncbi:ras-related protein RIC2-like, partial [Phasianus colchicus]|uniref:ras-related protein RIC2-like n=1 Tax=Phasianus colchicus TaxID=9054 RepID=UPI00129E6219
MPGPATPGSGPDPEESYDFLFKLVLIGDASVGKTCLVQRFKTGAFAERQGSTIGVDFTMKSLEIQGKRVKVSGGAEGRPLPRATVPARRGNCGGSCGRHGTARHSPRLPGPLPAPPALCLLIHPCGAAVLGGRAAQLRCLLPKRPWDEAEPSLCINFSSC